MHILLIVLLAVVAAEHAYFLYLEMFRWTAPRTLAAFGTTAEFAEASKTLAANQGLYNGFLAAGALWAIFAGDVLQRPLAIFFAGCVVAAGVYGGLTVSRRIMVIQAGPAALCLIVAMIA